MIVRKGSPFDAEGICNMLREYRAVTPLKSLEKIENPDHIAKMLSQIMAGAGLCLVAESEQEIVGMLLAIVQPSIWSKDVMVMHELAYWVTPKHRNGTAGYRLLSQYVAFGKAMKAFGHIEHFFVSKMVNSPDLKYDRFGFEKLEETWVI